MKIKYTPDAQFDLLDIKQYIFIDLENPEAAKKLLIKIGDRIIKNSSSPETGIKLENKIGRESNYRFWVIENYYVFYQWIKDEIIILGVIYKKRDYLKHFD